jgi:site-specific recombinase XerD
MTNLAKAAADYVALRRALGFKMVEVSHRLADFVRFARRERASRVTVDLAVRWAKLPATVQPVTWATRLRIVRQFAEYLSTIDPRTEIPPRSLLPGRYQRKAPYLYDDDEIQRLLQAA